jgi:hypothetical protein
VDFMQTSVGAQSLQAAAYAEPPLSPPVSPSSSRHVAPAQAPALAPVAPVTQPPAQSAAPAAVPSPTVPAAPAAPAAPAPSSVLQEQAQGPSPAAADQTVAIFLHLSSGERIWAGRFDTAQLAEQRAEEIVRALNRPEPGVWAKFGNRLIKPDAVVSIEIAPRRED